MEKVNGFIDIQAPCSEVFSTVAAIERRMQLSPLWGLNVLLYVSPSFPSPGSSYRIRVLQDAPFGIAGGGAGAVNSALAGLAHVMALKAGHALSDPVNEIMPAAPAVPGTSTPKDLIQSEQEYFIQEYDPPHRLSYAMEVGCKTTITWRLQSIPRGTRLSYEEVFCPEINGGEDFLLTVHHIIHEWLLNIKRYSELREGRMRLLLKKFLDRFFLKLRPDQRRTVLMILFMQGLALAMFIVAAIGLGISSLLF